MIRVKFRKVYLWIGEIENIIVCRSIDMRIDILKTIGVVNIYPYKCVPKQIDEVEERGHYQYLLGVPSEYSEAVEYELRKAERNDGWCKWKEIKRFILSAVGQV